MVVRFLAVTTVAVLLALPGCVQEGTDPTESSSDAPTPAGHDAPVDAAWSFQVDATAPSRHVLDLPAPTTVTVSLDLDRVAGTGFAVDLPASCDDLRPFGDGPTVSTSIQGASTTCRLRAGTHELVVSVDGVAEGRLSVRSR